MKTESKRDLLGPQMSSGHFHVLWSLEPTQPRRAARTHPTMPDFYLCWIGEMGTKHLLLGLHSQKWKATAPGEAGKSLSGKKV